MAAKDVLSAPVTAFPESKKLQRKVNVFHEVIESEKMEVRRIGREMRESISRKEEEVIRELDAIWDSVSVRIEEKKQEIQNIIEEIESQEKEVQKMYERMGSLFKSVKHTLTKQPLPQLSREIEIVKREMDISIPYVNVTWRVDELKESINRMLNCEQRSKENIFCELKWSNP